MLRKIIVVLLVVIVIGAVVLYSITRPIGPSIITPSYETTERGFKTVNYWNLENTAPLAISHDSTDEWIDITETNAGRGTANVNQSIEVEPFSSIDSATLEVAWRIASADNIDAGNTVYDSSSRTNDGLAMNGPVENKGKWDNCLSFDGADDYVMVPDDDSLDLTDMTLMAWIDIPSRAMYQAIITKGGPDDPKNYWLGVASNYGNWPDKGFFSMDAAEGGFHDFYSNSKWAGVGLVHVAATYDGSEMGLYLNGEPDGTKTVAFTPDESNAGPVGIGAEYHDTGTGWEDLAKGRIDEVRIYNRALTENEIKQIYEWTAPGMIAEENAVLWMTFDEFPLGCNFEAHLIAPDGTDTIVAEDRDLTTTDWKTHKVDVSDLITDDGTYEIMVYMEAELNGSSGTNEANIDNVQLTVITTT